ncbi:MAG: glycosyltransferase family 2 protein [Deltaproteobacteria bacterium]|nr:glycosyltransferase family 2 protein [Deltaproteobacteria bacterium]
MFLLVTPAYNEAENAEALVECVRRSTLRPDRWIVVDDRSTDGTGQRFLDVAGDLPIEVVPSGTTGGYMGFRYSEVVRAGVAAAGSDGENPTLFGILDCDIRFDANYWQDLADALRSDTGLGILSGALCSPDETGAMRLEKGQYVHLPRGGLRLVSGACFAAIGGVARSRAPDSVMNAKAITSGFRIGMLEHIVAWSVRPTDSRGSDEEGWQSRGRRAWNVGQPGWQVAVRAAAMSTRGRLGEGRALLSGYLDERKEGPRIDDADVLRYYRRMRPLEWGKSLRARLAGAEDPHRELAPRVVQLPSDEAS